MQLNVALGKPIIDGSGSWDGGTIGVGAPYDGGQFPARLAVDGVTYEADDATPSWWLGREGTLDEYFTLDLGDVYNVDRIDLFNTHNRQYNDRGTEEFVIFGAQQVDVNNQLIDPVPVLSGNLFETSFEEDLPAESFTSDNGFNPVDVRYLKFQSLSSTYGNSNVGLNEIEVYSSSFVTSNRAYGKPVIDGSGAWDGGTVGVGADFDAGQFPATAVTDGSIADGDNTIWLGREGVSDEYFTLDLGESVNVQEILLRNTTNRQYADRGTMDFRILAADAVDGANQLVNPVEILTGSCPIRPAYRPFWRRSLPRTTDWLRPTPAIFALKRPAGPISTTTLGSTRSRCTIRLSTSLRHCLATMWPWANPSLMAVAPGMVGMLARGRRLTEAVFLRLA